MPHHCGAEPVSDGLLVMDCHMNLVEKERSECSEFGVVLGISQANPSLFMLRGKTFF